jgi:transposase
MQKRVTARDRRRWITFYEANGRNAAATCRRFNIARSTFYRWLGRHDPGRPETLRDRSRRPHQERQPSWTWVDLDAVATVSMLHPRWGRGRVHEVMAAQGRSLSPATVGRILRILDDGCPICSGRDGVHDRVNHLLARSLAAKGVPPLMRAEKPPLTEKGAVRSAERILKKARRRPAS